MQKQVIFQGNQTNPVIRARAAALRSAGFLVSPLFTAAPIKTAYTVVLHTAASPLFGHHSPALVVAASAGVPVFFFGNIPPQAPAGFTWSPSFFLGEQCLKLQVIPTLF